MHANIIMINKGLASDEFIRKTLEDWKEVCDEESFAMIARRLYFFRHFQAIANILTIIKGKINDATITDYTGYDNPGEAKDQIAKDIENIQYCNFETLEKVNVDFIPTCTYQELSIPNGWSDEYLRLASQFDKAYKLIKSKPATNVNLPLNYELYTSFAEATEALINLATGMTWNNFPNDYMYILSEIKDSNKDAMERRKDMIAENKKKK